MKIAEHPTVRSEAPPWIPKDKIFHMAALAQQFLGHNKKKKIMPVLHYLKVGLFMIEEWAEKEHQLPQGFRL